MSKIPLKIKNNFEELLEMKTGYILDFSNSKFSDFVYDSIELTIYDKPPYEEYTSKANKLRQIWKYESDSLVYKLMKDLLDYAEIYYLKNKKNNEYTNKLIADLKIWINEYRERVQVSLPQTQEITLKMLNYDIERSLNHNMPELVLDRLHTFITGFLRQVCLNHSISIVNEQKKNLTLHSLMGALKKYYEKESLFQSSFTLCALTNSISLFDKFNEIRNNQSYAHYNNILNKLEAEYTIKTIVNLINFIDQIENINGNKYRGE